MLTANNMNTKAIEHDDFYDKLESIHDKLENHIELNEEEICVLISTDDVNAYDGFEKAYEEEGKPDETMQSVLTVIKDNKTNHCWAIPWIHELSEEYPNIYDEQPYQCILEQKPVTIIQTTVKPVNK